MTDERWTRIGDLWSLVRRLPPEARHERLREACSDDHSLVYQVESLLQHNASPEDVRHAFAEGVRKVVEGPWRTGTTIGPFTVQERVGVGAMGDVYSAYRNDLEQHVALKFFRTAQVSEVSDRDLQHEARVLAQLDSPNIAKLLGWERAADGTPVLVMEFVHGEPLDVYVQRTQPALRDRLDIFQAICRAVAAVHEKGFVHSDIKPRNVVVTPERVPKLLDFGVARHMDRPQEGLRGLTLAYASPEQLAGSVPTPVSDCYSLGVLLFNLLTGTVPFRLGDLELAEAAEVVRVSAPPRPSDILAGAARQVGGDSKVRQAVRTNGPTSQGVEGDLDAIVLKALMKDPDDRYASAGDLAEDVRRHLDNEPVTAHPRTPAYLCIKYLRRHRRGALIAAAVCLLTLAVGLWVSSIREAFALAGARASLKTGQDLYEKGLFADALQTYDGGLADIAPDKVSPGKCRKEAFELLLGSGNSHLALVLKSEKPESEAERAIQRFESALAIAGGDPTSESLAIAQQALGEALLSRARIHERGKNLQEAIAAYQRAAACNKPSRPRAYAASLAGLAEAHLRLAQIRDPGANLQLALTNATSALQVLTPDQDHSDYLRARLVMVLVTASLAGRGSDPAKGAEGAIRAIDEVLSLVHPDTDGRIFAQALHAKASLYTRLAMILQREELFREAEKSFLAALELFHPRSQPFDYAKVTGNLGSLYLTWADYCARVDRTADRLAFLEKSRVHMDKAAAAFPFSEAPLDWGHCHYNLALVLVDLGDEKQDAEMLQSAVSHGESARRVFREPDYPEQYAALAVPIGSALVIQGSLKSDPATIRRGLEVLVEPLPYFEKTKSLERVAIVQRQIGTGNRLLWRLTKDPDDARRAVHAFDRSLQLLPRSPAEAASVRRERAEFQAELSRTH